MIFHNRRLEWIHQSSVACFLGVTYGTEKEHFLEIDFLQIWAQRRENFAHNSGYLCQPTNNLKYLLSVLENKHVFYKNSYLTLIYNCFWNNSLFSLKTAPIESHVSRNQHIEMFSYTLLFECWLAQKGSFYFPFTSTEWQLKLPKRFVCFHVNFCSRVHFALDILVPIFNKSQFTLTQTFHCSSLIAHPNFS